MNLQSCFGNVIYNKKKKLEKKQVKEDSFRQPEERVEREVRERRELITPFKLSLVPFFFPIRVGQATLIKGVNSIVDKG